MSREWSTPMVEVPVLEAERKAKAELHRLRDEFTALSKSYDGDYYLEGAAEEIRKILNGGSAR